MNLPEKKLSKIAFLSSDIEKLDAIIDKYQNGLQEDGDKVGEFMLQQYEYRREKLYRLLCIELLLLPMESTVHFLPLVQNIATIYTQSTELLPHLKQNIQRWVTI